MGAGHSFMGFGGFMGIWTWLILAVIIALIIWAFTSRKSSGYSGGPGRHSPEDMLKRRLANGEITPEEYRKLLTELRR